RAREVARESLTSGSKSTSRDDVLTDTLLGELEITHLTASAVLEHTTAAIQATEDTTEALALAISMKEAVTKSAVEVVDHAVAIVGGRAFHRRSILERLARDVRAARHHPPAAPVAQQMVGMAQNL
ncbi:MAG: acyl-CoA dehydrogenase family protein, partial [Acidimicrobiales bacterium]